MFYLMVLATIMAIFGVIGYLSGSRASLFTTIVLLFGLLLVSRAGGTIARLINGLYFGVRFVMAGGVQALGASGDRSAAITATIQNMGSVDPLIPPNSPGLELVIVLVVLVLVSSWLARRPRFHLVGSASGWGLLWGLVNGYLLGAYLISSLWPTQAGIFALPFVSRPATAAAAPSVPAGPNILDQFVQGVQSASQNTLAFIIMLLIAIFVIVSAYAASRATGRSK